MDLSLGSSMSMQQLGAQLHGPAKTTRTPLMLVESSSTTDRTMAIIAVYKNPLLLSRRIVRDGTASCLVPCLMLKRYLQNRKHYFHLPQA